MDNFLKMKITVIKIFIQLMLMLYHIRKEIYIHANMQELLKLEKTIIYSIVQIMRVLVTHIVIHAPKVHHIVQVVCVVIQYVNNNNIK